MKIRIFLFASQYQKRKRSRKVMIFFLKKLSFQLRKPSITNSSTFYHHLIHQKSCHFCGLSLILMPETLLKQFQFYFFQKIFHTKIAKFSTVKHSNSVPIYWFYFFSSMNLPTFINQWIVFQVWKFKNAGLKWKVSTIPILHIRI